ncbi:integral membrane protein (macronuclear) [Tetrahymena thermophila SB210]|uniref:Integral membrane protein n=1 Tax=Tetrahymena thermophila (strain SB210) TaxID=312017 RepID=Q22DU3_TETTS|nr:integral membrane protein [Tetrahymena thermophila SB210]EAR83462.1 integral membrane protein [Tetrahymena thermophila SB210]|eukprot:XP_001031125.1 integral membrane protein [Tetrahymena thermophila SB210]
MLTRNLDKARQAYYEGNVEMSKKAHRNETVQGQEDEKLKSDHNEDHNNSGAYIKSAVYGGLDGTITTYSVVMGVAGANLATIVVVALGVANLIGDGICMALGDYLSTKSEIEFQRKERAREEWEVENNPDEEKNEMVELYEQKGITREDARSVVEIISKNKQAWVDIMMIEELGLLPEEEDPVKNAIVTFIAFVLFGLIPLIPFIIIEIASIKASNTLFYVSTAMTATFLFILGFTKSMFTYSKWWKSGLETLLIGVVAAGSSYLIGLAFRPLTDGASA